MESESRAEDRSDRSEELVLGAQLCFALQSAARAIVASYRPGLEHLGLTYSQYTVMLVLWEHGAVTMGFLGERLHLDSGTLSPLLKRLEQHGLVQRRRRPQDERTVEIVPTEQGAALRDAAAEVQRGVADATGMTAARLEELRGELDALTAQLREP